MTYFQLYNVLFNLFDMNIGGHSIKLYVEGNRTGSVTKCLFCLTYAVINLHSLCFSFLQCKDFHFDFGTYFYQRQVGFRCINVVIFTKVLIQFDTLTIILFDAFGDMIQVFLFFGNHSIENAFDMTKSNFASFVSDGLEPDHGPKFKKPIQAFCCEGTQLIFKIISAKVEKMKNEVNKCYEIAESHLSVVSISEVILWCVPFFLSLQNDTRGKSE